MREIKFRGKYIKTGKWTYGYLMNRHSEYRLFIGEWKRIGGEATIKDELFASYKEVDPKTVGGYTGLEDCNGQPIYEGDIMGIQGSEDKSRFKVEFSNGSYRKVYSQWGKFECLALTKEDIDRSGWEVIGNIHEHKHLLDETT